MALKNKLLRPKNKKSQVKVQETLFMILGLAVFFLIAGMFYLSITLSGLKTRVRESTRTGNILLVVSLADSPEFSCGGESICIDTDKVIPLMNNPNYNGFWNVNGMVIEKLERTKDIECSGANYPNCNIFTVKKPQNQTIGDSSIVSLCRKEYENGYSYDKCELGKIIVWTLA